MNRRAGSCAALCALCVFWVVCGVRAGRAQEPGAPQPGPGPSLQAAIDELGNLDYATRMNAGRTVRRTPGAQAVPALMEAVAKHTDGYVRYRSLVLLTGFNDPRTKDSMPPCGGPTGRLTTDPPRGSLPRR